MKIIHLYPSSHFLTSSHSLPLVFLTHFPLSLSLICQRNRSFFAFVKKVRNSPAAHEENHRTLVTLTAFIIGKQASITAAAYTAGFTGTKTEKKNTVTIATGTKQKPLYYSLLASPRPKCFTCHKNCISDTLLALEQNITAFC